jgi:outer membrane receptor protein involved in Fe transport
MWVMQESLNLAETTRMGADLGLRYQLNDWLYFDADANYTYARSIDEMGKTTFPCTRFHVTGGLSFQNGMDFREDLPLFKSRPANEDNSIVAKGYAIADLISIMNLVSISLEFQ